MSEMKVSDYIAKFLESNDIRHVFGIVGAGVEFKLLVEEELLVEDELLEELNLFKSELAPIVVSLYPQIVS